MEKQCSKFKEFLNDLRSGMSFSDLISKYNLPDGAMDEICRKLSRSDLSALFMLWRQDKLSESQFTRAFSELEEDLNQKSREED